MPDFQIAIGLANFSATESYNDPSYIQWVAQYIEYSVGGSYEDVFDPFPLHHALMRTCLTSISWRKKYQKPR